MANAKPDRNNDNRDSNTGPKAHRKGQKFADGSTYETGKPAPPFRPGQGANSAGESAGQQREKKPRHIPRVGTGQQSGGDQMPGGAPQGGDRPQFDGPRTGGNNAGGERPRFDGNSRPPSPRPPAAQPPATRPPSTRPPSDGPRYGGNGGGAGNRPWLGNSAGPNDNSRGEGGGGSKSRPWLGNSGGGNDSQRGEGGGGGAKNRPWLGNSGSNAGGGSTDGQRGDTGGPPKNRPWLGNSGGPTQRPWLGNNGGQGDRPNDRQNDRPTGRPQQGGSPNRQRPPGYEGQPLIDRPGASRFSRPSQDGGVRGPRGNDNGRPPFARPNNRSLGAGQKAARPFQPNRDASGGAGREQTSPTDAVQSSAANTAAVEPANVTPLTQNTADRIASSAEVVNLIDSSAAAPVTPVVKSSTAKKPRKAAAPADAILISEPSGKADPVASDSEMPQSESGNSHVEAVLETVQQSVAPLEASAADSADVSLEPKQIVGDPPSVRTTAKKKRKADTVESEPALAISHGLAGAEASSAITRDADETAEPVAFNDTKLAAPKSPAPQDSVPVSSDKYTAALESAPVAVVDTIALNEPAADEPVADEPDSKVITADTVANEAPAQDLAHEPVSASPAAVESEPVGNEVHDFHPAALIEGDPVSATSDVAEPASPQKTEAKLKRAAKPTSTSIAGDTPTGKVPASKATTKNGPAESAESESGTPAAIGFADLGLSATILDSIAKAGYESPTPIQASAIPIMLAGRDLIGQAQTGTGKTAAFALPLLDKIERDKPVVQVIVLAPTRELAVQVASGIHGFSAGLGVRTAAVYGGQPIDRQFRALREGAQIVVGTPGRVLDHMRRGTLSLSEVKICVLDEADEMLALGFLEEVEAVLKDMPADHQTALFSATISPRVQALAKTFMRNPQNVAIESRRRTVDTTKQTYYDVPHGKKQDALARVLDMETPGPTIVFCRTRMETDQLAEALRLRGYGAEALHGDMGQSERERVLKRFREGQADLLVATDVAARGLDIDSVTHVINYDIPWDVEQYIHRVGRTGRAGRTGDAITLVTPKERRQLAFIEQTIGAKIAPARVPTASDIAARRRQRFQEALIETLTEADYDGYMSVVGDLSEEYDTNNIAAAALKMLWKLWSGTAGSIDEQAAVESSVASVGMARLFIGMGKQDGLRPGDIVGALTREIGMDGKRIGAIDILDREAFVEVPTEEAQDVLTALRKTRLRNRKITVQYAGPDRGAQLR